MCSFALTIFSKTSFVHSLLQARLSLLDFPAVYDPQSCGGSKLSKNKDFNVFQIYLSK